MCLLSHATSRVDCINAGLLSTSCAVIKRGGRYLRPDRCRSVAVDLTSPLCFCSTGSTACRAAEDGATPESERTANEDAKIEEVRTRDAPMSAFVWLTSKIHSVVGSARPFRIVLL